MIHSHIVIDRITELIKLTGVSDEEMIEEMTDHYLTDIEYAIEQGISEQNAIRNTYQRIASSHVTVTNKKPIRIHTWIIASVSIALLISCFFYQNTQQEDPMRTGRKSVKSEIPDGWPIQSDFNQISSNFGVRYNPISKTKRFHKGIDIIAKKGTPVFATGHGVVAESGYTPTSGHYIIIRHGDRYSTRYLHLSKINVTNGQNLKKGERIGLVGNSGMSIAPHLHYEVIKNKTVVDPIEVMSP